MKPEFRFIDANGVGIRAVITGEGPLVVMTHGFPESWYSWRHQMESLSAAGFTACAIDVRGYGGSAKPHEISAYGLRELAGDVAGVIAALSPNEKAVVIGHDWGAPIAYAAALAHPDRVRAVAGLSVPYVGVGHKPLLDLMHDIFTANGRFFYQVYFQDEGVAEAELEADVRGALRKIYYAWSAEGAWPHDKKIGDRLLTGLIDPDPFPAWLSEADIEYYAGEFARSGFRGPLNRYRNSQADYDFLAPFMAGKLMQPSLFIAGEKDPVLSMFAGVDLVALMRMRAADLRAVHILPGVGHWTQQEAPDAVSGHLIDWLAEL